MNKRTALSVALIVSASLVSAVRAQDTTEARRLGYLLGYHEAILELDNGKVFCVSSSSLAASSEVIEKRRSTFDPKKPAKGIAAALAEAFPCKDPDFNLSLFSSTESPRRFCNQRSRMK